MRDCQQQSLALLRKYLTKEHLCWDAVQMLPKLVLIHSTACNADSQRTVSHGLNVYGMLSLGTLERLSALSKMS